MDTRTDPCGATTDAPHPPRRTYRVAIPALGRELICNDDESLLAAARRHGVRIVGACGGRGSCGSCVVRVNEGRVQRDGEAPHKTWLRACRLQPRSDLSIEIAPRSLAPVVRVDVRNAGEDAPLALQSAVCEAIVKCAPATLSDLASDTTRVRRALAMQHPALHAPHAIEAAAVAGVSGLLRANDWRIAVRIAADPAGPRLAGFAAPGAPLLGLAVDLGTTNAAAFLVDLNSGRRLASLGLENPQVAWGADLIGRINQSIRTPGAADALRRAAAEAIDALAHDLAGAVGATAADIVDAAVCGNTAMQHLLAGWPVAQLGRAPFVSACDEPLDLPAAALGLHLAPGARVHLAPVIGGFVGGDHVAAMLATEPLWSRLGVTLVMDIGTNTEISLVEQNGGSRRIVSASCPSGPALEGGHVACGMRAAEGAIEGVTIDASGALQLQVIGRGPPVGLCGSGVLDALAAFVRAGWVDARGRIAHGVPGACVVDAVRAITLADETAEIPAVRFTQRDVRAVQLAKSAIRTGVALLAAEIGASEADIDRFVIAGAFGAYIDVASAIAIGLLPPLPRERFTQVGNAAGLGIQQMLASTERRTRAARLAVECRYTELSSRGDFQKTFLSHIGFTP